MPEALGYSRRPKSLGRKERVKSGSRGLKTSRLWCERRRQCVKTELAIQVTASSCVQFIETRDGTHNPPGINRLGDGGEFFCQRNISQDRLLHSGGELEKISEKAIKDAELIFERRLAVFGEGGRAGEELSETLALGGAFEDAERVAAAVGGFSNIHFNGQPRATFGELRCHF